MLISGKKWTLSCLKWVIFKIQLSRLICRNEWKSIMITSKILKNYSFSFDSWKHGSVFFLSFHQDDSSYSQILHLKIMIISEIYSIDLTEPYCWFFFFKGLWYCRISLILGHLFDWVTFRYSGKPFLSFGLVGTFYYTLFKWNE